MKGFLLLVVLASLLVLPSVFAIDPITVTYVGGALSAVGTDYQLVIPPGGQRDSFQFVADNANDATLNTPVVTVQLQIDQAAQQISITPDGVTPIAVINAPQAGTYTISFTGITAAASVTIGYVTVTTAGAPVTATIKGYVATIAQTTPTLAQIGALANTPAAFTNVNPAVTLSITNFNTPMTVIDNLNIPISVKYNGKETRTTRIVNIRAAQTAASTGTVTFSIPMNAYIITSGGNTQTGSIEKRSENSLQVMALPATSFLADTRITTHLTASALGSFLTLTAPSTGVNVWTKNGNSVANVVTYIVYMDTNVATGHATVFLEQATAVAASITRLGGTATLLPASSITESTWPSYQENFFKNHVHLIYGTQGDIEGQSSIVQGIYNDPLGFAKWLWLIPFSPTYLNASNITAFNSTGLYLNATGNISLAGKNITCFGPASNVSFNTTAAGNLSNFTNLTDSIDFPELNATNSTNGTATNGSIVICTDPGIDGPAAIVSVGGSTFASTIPPLTIASSTVGVGGTAAIDTLISTTLSPSYVAAAGFPGTIAIATPYSTVSSLTATAAGFGPFGSGSTAVWMPVPWFLGGSGFAVAFPNGWATHSILQTGSGSPMSGTGTFSMNVRLADYLKYASQGKSPTVGNTNVNAIKVAATTAGSPPASGQAIIRAAGGVSNSITVTSVTEVATSSGTQVNIVGTFNSATTGYAFGSESNLTIYDETDSTTQYPGDSIDFFADYYNATSGADILGASCNASFSIDSTTSAMTYNAVAGAYKTTKAYGSSGTTAWNVSCYSTTFNETLWANDTVTIATMGVPEFSTWTLLIALAGVMVGFFVIRARKGI